MVYAYQGTVADGPKFFDHLDAEARAIADPSGDLYAAFAVARGGWREMFGVRAWRAGLAATLAGHRINRKVGDPWTLPSMFAIDGDRVIWEFRGEHAGDHPDVASIPAMLTGAEV